MIYRKRFLVYSSPLPRILSTMGSRTHVLSPCDEPNNYGTCNGVSKGAMHLSFNQISRDSDHEQHSNHLWKKSDCIYSTILVPLRIPIRMGDLKFSRFIHRRTVSHLRSPPKNKSCNWVPEKYSTLVLVGTGCHHEEWQIGRTNI